MDLGGAMRTLRVWTSGTMLKNVIPLAIYGAKSGLQRLK
jgi:hypothetical protein